MDNEENKGINIAPAINTASVGSKQMSPQEFQTTLYYWFNQKGLVSNIRSYLRMKMINVLRSTAMGISLNTNANISLENQVLNILIADYLFQHRYDYSLSVFSTEVPIKNLVSEFCFFVFNKEKTNTRHKIDEENVMCIVESLGIGANSGLAREILEHYKRIENGSLLLCILKIVMNYYKPEASSEDGHIEEISKVIRKIMLHFDLPTSLINHIIDKMNHIVKSHVNNALTKLSKHYEQEKSILQKEYETKENQFKQKLMEVDTFLNDEMKKIEKEHKKLVYLTENMVLNEKKLAEKSFELDSKLKKVNEIELKLMDQLKHCARASAQAINRTCKLAHCDNQCEENRKGIEELRVQKNSFEKITENQNILIANLTAKSNIMYRQLQEGINTIEDLRVQLAEQKELLQAERRKNQELAERTTSVSEVSAATVLTDGEGDYTIEDAIKQSHMKLQQLEKESTEIEKKFQQFQLTIPQ